MRGAIAAAGSAAALPALQSLGLLSLNNRAYAALGQGGYGPLAPAPDLRDGALRISLPEGFTYRSFSEAGTIMSDGNAVPLAHDGMAVFAMPNGKFRLVRNHEDRNGPRAGSTAVDGNAYDPWGGGGTTTLVVNPFTRELERDFISMSGTIVNCAGGITPWNTWITCEETNAGPSGGWAMQHGYCFDVPVAAETTVPAIPIPDMGRFSHEAVAVDPETWIVYETEDNGANNSGFYRFLANTPGVLANGGRLQMLAIRRPPELQHAPQPDRRARAAGRVGRHSRSESSRHERDGGLQSGLCDVGARASRGSKGAGGGTAPSTLRRPAAETPAADRSGSSGRRMTVER